MNLRNLKTVTERRQAVESALDVDLPNIGSFTLDELVAGSRNCENMIGATQVPLGIAGPLTLSDINNQKSKSYYIPLATTEGALVASVNRGCKAITESGGAVVDSHRVGATRGPVFRVKNLKEHDRMYRYFKSNVDELNVIAQKTSHYIKLEKLLTRGVGRYRYVRFVFNTQDAMGMNMATIATQALVTHIEEKFDVSCVALAGNFDIDKKPSWLNAIENRGTKVWAEVTIPARVLKTVLKTSAHKVYDVWLAKCMIGSALAGSMAFNAQYANIVAALFLATGQDLGHVGEGSIGITTAEVVDDKDLYVSVTLPDLMVGVVGGGTGLSTQKEALSIVGAKTSQEFAEVVGAAVLAGEISLLSSLAEGTLAKAHQTLARGEARSTKSEIRKNIKNTT
ncbi:MAG TPA: hydroxymethylglutaryl-CoA reductase [Patescibacteria group bacterium]|nr:hydroxymethylglutaryl-CoA reductase [Patescibacteria group bacterium]